MTFSWQFISQIDSVQHIFFFLIITRQCGITGHYIVLCVDVHSVKVYFLKKKKLLPTHNLMVDWLEYTEMSNIYGECSQLEFGSVCEGHHSRQLLALQQLQAGPSPRAHVADLVGLPEFLCTGGGVPSP